MPSLPILIGLLLAANAPTATRIDSSDPAFSRWLHGNLSGMTSFTVARDELPDLELYVFQDDVHRPLVLLLPGSVCEPLFQPVRTDRGMGIATSLVLPSPAARQQGAYHLAMLERRGQTSFGEPIDVGPVQTGCETASDITLEARTRDTLDTIHALAALPWVGPIYLAGSSEGADVAAAVGAVGGDAVHGLLLMGGAGASQFFDLVTLARESGDEAVDARFDELLSFAGGLREEDYLGYPAARWESYAIRTSVLDKLLASRMPVMIVHGDNDQSVPIAASDLLAVELFRRQSNRSIWYWSISGAGHALNLPSGEMLDPIDDFLDWLQQGAPRGFSNSRTYALDD